MKAAFAAIIGRPSVGKSTLLNTLCGNKVSIVAPSPQTTRNTIRGIHSDERGQIVFLDTPGFHDSEKKMNRYLKENALSALQEIDLVVYMIDPTRPAGVEEKTLMALLAPRNRTTIAVINKSDLPGARIEQISELLRSELDPAELLVLSARTGEGTEKLLEVLYSHAPEGEPFYPPEYYTDQEPGFRASEIIREWAVNRVSQEVPHAIYVEIADMEEREVQTSAGETRYKLWIRAFLVVERESQKGILVGKKGKLISEIRKGARKDLEKIFPHRVELDLRVKVNPKWRNKDPLLKRLLS
ncbi:GTPase Era [Marispirochaeta aestuarii]|uniref:GTPase Era n=1 Tax=Marispirochaeta aestuarii TaxID=1963862 RepID=A0A1Y1RY13_9SPIO|nr:GTPase Era [Marispirochaeta aestuarii]ORC35347.1 GTPase Era [Marispirochaeta aestuarii]